MFKICSFRSCWGLFQLSTCGLFSKSFPFCHSLQPQIPKVLNDVQSNKVKRGALRAVSVSHIHITKWDATVKILFLKQPLCAFLVPQDVPYHCRKYEKTFALYWIGLFSLSITHSDFNSESRSFYNQLYWFLVKLFKQIVTI